jgi:uncharacterized membrane protein
VLSASAQAVELEYYGVESSITDDLAVKNVLTIRFAEPVNSLEFLLEYKADNFSAEANFDSAECRLLEEGGKSRIMCSFKGMSESRNLLTITLYSKEGLSSQNTKYTFSTNYRIWVPAKEAFILVKIPQNSVLSDEPANQSYSPSDGKILSDGKFIMVYWQRENVTAADDLLFSVSYTIPILTAVYNNFLIVLIAAVIIISMVTVAIYVRKGPVAEKTTADVVASVLNSDEKKVVDILARHGGRSGQKVIVRESDFSKAKVSRLVKSLKNRGVVNIEPISGRENRIILRFEKRPEPREGDEKAEPGSPEKGEA